MKWLVLMLAMILAAVVNAGHGSEAITYYVQLIRGSDQEQSPVATSKKIAPNLAGAFRSVFKWRTYWEISSHRVDLENGRSTRIRLNPEREVEIDLSIPDRRAVSAFLKGKMVQRTVCPRSENRTLIGGDRDGNSPWFIIVSRSKPEA